MRILVTGRHGQLAQCLHERAALVPGTHVTALGRPDIDLSQPGDLAAPFSVFAPDIIVNAAAYTAVDRAEAEPRLAFAINCAGARAVARAAARLGVPVIQISTDYVFAGDKPSPYAENDETGPLGAYGRSKLEGELAVAAEWPRHLILRTSWVYSPFGTNFVKTMLQLAATRDVIAVVADQVGNPTSAMDLADTILSVGPELRSSPDFCGTFHLAGHGQTSWCDFARHIFAVSREAGGPVAEVQPIAAADFPAAARRPPNSRLDCAKFTQVFGRALPHWKASSRACVLRLLQNPP